MNESLSKWELLLIILVIISAFLFLRTCNEPPAEIQTITRVDSFYKDTGTYHIGHIETPVPFKVIKTDTLWLDRYINDTINNADSFLYAIAEDYFSTRQYSDSLNDSNISVRVNYAVKENRTRNLSIDYKWKKPLIQYTTINQPAPLPRNSLWIGNQLTVWEQLYIGADIGLMVKNKSLYSIGANLPITGTNKYIYFRYNYKIF